MIAPAQMERMKMTLPIKRKWWDMIRSGEKKAEYRDITPYYAKRFATALGMYHRQLNPKRMEETDARVPIHNIVLRAGYSLDSPTMMVGGMLRVGQGRTEWEPSRGLNISSLK